MSEFKYEVTFDHNYSWSPREDDNLGTIITWHRRYSIGDINNDSENPYEWAVKFQRENPGAIILPVYMYDHSGISISTSPFSCPWDSGQVGYIYVTREKALECMMWKKLTAERRQDIIRMLENEIKTYDAYLNGNIYQYVISEWDGDECIDECVESCSGFYSEEECEADAQSMVKWCEEQSYVKQERGSFAVAVMGV